ncbi:discoidin domain-containing protein [Streptomyces sp. NBC_00133]|uniref:discoidin domain-containing protein n=2 Tax=unclassified Streptomyces TaxID=2593676 RepID=UPI003863D86B
MRLFPHARKAPPSPPISRLRARILAALTGVLALLAASMAGATGTHAVAPPPPAGWTEVFLDDFTGSGGLGGNWIYRTGHQIPGGPANWGTGEVEDNTTSTANVFQSGGNLNIRALRDGAGNWTSGRIETARDDFQAPAGGVLAFEGRMQLPNVTAGAAVGYWPAFWVLGQPYRGNLWNWPSVGEMDIMENVQGLNTEWGTMHCGTSPGGECNEKDGRSANTPGGSPSLQTGMHTYRVEWDKSRSPNEIRWYLDGRQFHAVNQSQISSGTWAAAFNHGFYMILNLAIGGEFPAKTGGGPTGSTASGGTLVVDYVRVLSRTGGGSDPGDPAPPTCGPLLSKNKPATTSSIENASLGPQYAVDGNTGTRWSSAHVDTGWLQVDLGSAQPLTRVRLNWETAYSSHYQIQLSTNGSSWSTPVDRFGDGGIDDLAVNGTARYVRMNGLARGTVYGHSLWEMEVFGACPGGGDPGPGDPDPPGTTTWSPGVAYTVGQMVLYNGVTYTCRQAHTSIVTWEPPNTPALWLAS